MLDVASVYVNIGKFKSKTIMSKVKLFWLNSKWKIPAGDQIFPPGAFFFFEKFRKSYVSVFRSNAYT